MESFHKAIMKSKERTNLTVLKALSDKSMEIVTKTDDIREMIKEFIEYGNSMLSKITHMLPELKQAGVVDAGEKGLLSILEGDFLEFGKDKYNELDISTNITFNRPTNIDNVNIKHSYCTKFLLILIVTTLLYRR